MSTETEQAYVLSPEEAAEFLRSSLPVTSRTLRRWAAQGRVASFVTPGGHRRFRRTDLEAFINAHTSTVRVASGPADERYCAGDQ